METPVTSLRIPMGTRTALTALAKAERRSFANYVNRVLEEHMEAQGLMLCPDCMGAAVVGVDDDGHPDLCDTCDGMGHVKNRRARGKTATPSD